MFVFGSGLFTNDVINLKHQRGGQKLMIGWHKHQGVSETPKNADVICEWPLTAHTTSLELQSYTCSFLKILFKISSKKLYWRQEAKSERCSGGWTTNYGWETPVVSVASLQSCCRVSLGSPHCSALGWQRCHQYSHLTNTMTKGSQHHQQCWAVVVNAADNTGWCVTLCFGGWMFTWKTTFRK